MRNRFRINCKLNRIKSTSRMLSHCCQGLTCSCEQVINSCELGGERDVSHFSKEERTQAFAEPTRMDIAHLKEQYNWIKEKQKLQTHVVLFKKAPNNEDICGKSLVNMVPVSQEVGSPKSFEEQMPIMKVAFNFVDDPDSGQTPWRTHLGIHRMTRTGKWIKASNTHISTAINNPTTNPTNAKDVSVECCEHPHVEPIASEKLNGPRCHDSGDKGEDVASANRKCSSTEAFSKPFSVAAHRSSQPSLNSHYYPFPQRKCPKKSEAARRLGMYS